MNNHLPECPAPTRETDMWRCICDRLRACEQRVRKNAIETIYEAQKESYVRGLDAAREAVADLPYEEFTGDLEGIVWIDQEQALAAIDALREEQT